MGDGSAKLFKHFIGDGWRAVVVASLFLLTRRILKRSAGLTNSSEDGIVAGRAGDAIMVLLVYRLD